MNRTSLALVTCMLVAPPASSPASGDVTHAAGNAASHADAGGEATHAASMPKAVNVNLADVPWSRMFPDYGDRSPEISILRSDPDSRATQLLIRVPKNFHVTPHWHSSNETHTVLSGTFIMKCDGRQDTLVAGGFNYVPSKMVHEAWTLPGEPTVVFITVDHGWDVNFVAGPPVPRELEKPEKAGH